MGVSRVCIWGLSVHGLTKFPLQDGLHFFVLSVCFFKLRSFITCGGIDHSVNLCHTATNYLMEPKL
ncbi:hypothetical protein [Klebsiella phage BUCT_49532]|uniref:hypothetical protein n=1 Tax=Klebsiella phage BUCT_49532 TaxID=2849971 RepID=UPI001C795D2A|nr:hypothetical protein PQZ56_gp67 [Klebsiella phage BUCT_49532]WCI99763.1 hypothetical protein [Klebsiella phage BUCT_49532]